MLYFWNNWSQRDAKTRRDVTSQMIKFFQSISFIVALLSCQMGDKTADNEESDTKVLGSNTDLRFPEIVLYNTQMDSSKGEIKGPAIDYMDSEVELMYLAGAKVVCLNIFSKYAPSKPWESNTIVNNVVLPIFLNESNGISVLQYSKNFTFDSISYGYSPEYPEGIVNFDTYKIINGDTINSMALEAVKKFNLTQYDKLLKLPPKTSINIHSWSPSDFTFLGSASNISTTEELTSLVENRIAIIGDFHSYKDDRNVVNYNDQKIFGTVLLANQILTLLNKNLP